MTPGIRPLIAGNWKMNGLRATLKELVAIEEAHDVNAQKKCDVLVCVPFTLLYPASEVALGSKVAIGAQNCHAATSGAHTGEISAAMVANCGATQVIVGHSERRADNGETSMLVCAKAVAAIENQLIAIICVGETEAERKSGRTLDVIGEQIAGSVPDAATSKNTVIAYEPVWAIGTGLTPTLDDVAEVHRFLRGKLSDRFGAAGANMRLLYGGSVKPDNAGELLAVGNVDGALVGGASLKADDFNAIIAACP